MDGRGVVLGVIVDGANRHDQKLLAPTLQSMPLHYPNIRKMSLHLCLDKGYDTPSIERWLAEQGFTPHIRRRGEIFSGTR